MDLAVEVPKDELGATATNAIWKEIYESIAMLAKEHKSTIIFVNTRWLAERVRHHLAEHLGNDAITIHYGNLLRSSRLTAKEQLKCGQTKVMLATASLKLGIDVGPVNLICQIGSPRVVATCLQLVGRSGHMLDAMPKGRLFATTRDELLECAALIKAICAGQLDAVSIQWWNLLVQYRRLESEDEIRGGGFISGVTDEQFALAEAVESLRAVRRSGNGVPERLTVSATDPLNLLGIIAPGPKVPAHGMHSVLFENGVSQPETNASLPFASSN